MPTIDIDDATIHYESTGSGPSVLFVHGLCGDGDTFVDQSRRLSDRYRCVRYDRRGHSRSTRGSAPIGPSRHADDAARLIEELGLAPCLVVGSSGGGVVTVDLALRYGHLLRGVVLSEPPLFSIAPGTSEVAMAEIGPLVERADATGDARGFVDGFFPIVCAGLWKGIDDERRDAFRANGEVGLEDLRAMSLDVSGEDLAAVGLPALVVAGDTSPPFHREIADRLAAHWPDARFVELAGSGHVTYFEQPDAFEAAVRAFAGELDR